MEKSELQKWKIGQIELQKMYNKIQNKTKQIKKQINLLQDTLEQFKQRQSILEKRLEQIATMQNLSQNELNHKNPKPIARWTRADCRNEKN